MNICSHLILLFYKGNQREWKEALALLISTSLLLFFLSVVEEAGSVELTRMVDRLCKQFHHLIHTETKITA